MPVSSAEIAQANFAWQQQAANNYAYSQQIGQVYGGGYSGTPRADALMGGAMNRASSIGVPLAAGAMGLMGLDPLSMGIRAGIGAYGAGAGFGGAALVGGAVAMPMMAAGAAATYAGGQMMNGAGQQAALNSTLRGSFSFRNNYGGQGFSRSDMSAIGEMVRTMSEQVGPGGEIASYQELTALTGKMGTMGLAQGVRDVKEFGHRFKEMVDHLKTMARDLGTTLEGAMEFAASAKGSGIFGMNRTSSFTSAVRSASVSGGLAISEVTGAASIGSQIARSVGGLGRQGAMAGVRTIGQIGTAQQLGILSDEDVYNATGLSGAEGRQALAANQLGRTAHWLQSGRGRLLLASLAEKNGGIDEGAVQELLSGGMSISETRRHYAGVKFGTRMSRANFIRNEGRLRGAAMERLGAFLPALQLQEWAQTKGIDINDMDDRSMLFAQRQLGMGRDEMDVAMKMVNHMPRILEEQRRSEQRDEYSQRLGELRKGQGIEGLKQRFGQARHAINSKLQKVGQDIFNEGAQRIDEYMNSLLGTYVDTYSKDIDDAYSAMREGGLTGAKAGANAFGGRSSSVFAQQFGTKGLSLGQSRGTVDLFSGTRGTLGATLNAGSYSRMDGAYALPAAGLRKVRDIASYIFHGQSLAGKLQDAGIDIHGMDVGQVQQKLQSIQASQIAAATGYDESLVHLGQEQGGDWIRRAYAQDRVTGNNDLRMQTFEQLLQTTSEGGGADAQKAQVLLSRWKGAKTQAEKATLMANIERGNQIKDNYALANNLGVSTDILSRLNPLHGFTSERAGNEAFAHAMGFSSTKGPSAKAKRWGAALLGLGVNDEGTLTSRLLHRLGAVATGAAGEEQAVGAFYRGKEGRDTLAGIFSEDADTRKRMQASLMEQIGQRDKEDPTRGEMQKLLGAGEYADLLAQGGPVSDKQLSEIAERNNMSVSELRDKTKNAFGVLTAIQKGNSEKEDLRVQGYAQTQAKKLGALGVYDAAHGKLTADVSGLSKEDQFLARQYLSDESSLFTEQLGGRGVEDKAKGLYQASAASLSYMSTAGKKKLAEQLAGTEMGAEISGFVGAETRFAGLTRRKGVAGAAASFLGVDMSRDELSKLDLKSEAGASRLLARAGADTSDAAVKELQQAAKTGGNDLADSLKRIADRMEAEKEKKAADKEEEKDELQKAMKHNSDRANQLLEALVRSNKQATEALAKLDKKDPEPHGQSSPQPTPHT